VARAFVIALFVCSVIVTPVLAHGMPNRLALDRVNRTLAGRVIDYTHNHGKDCRIWANALCQKRDMYVYVPPCFDRSRTYPLMIWFHGFAQDEKSFLTYVAPKLDQAIVEGRLPPMIVVAPDGSVPGTFFELNAGSFFINSKAGAFEDFIIQDVYPFMLQNYPVAANREAHILAGVSMGGNSAFNLGFKHRDQFKVVVGVYPPLNTRWIDCHGHYMANFNPCCWGWRENFSRSHEVVGRFYGVVTIPLKDIIRPLYDIGPDTSARVAYDNPIEMIDRLCIRDGELDMYIAYGGLDQFNIDAQVESFLYRARERGLTIQVGYEPKGKHDAATAYKLLPDILCWLKCKLAGSGPR
jgi:S-formylglutathione hydrolase FrmB